MTRVVEQLAELTGFRDRDLLDVMLVGTLRDLLRPQALGIYRVVEDDQRRPRWLTRARLGESDTVAEADPLWTELSTLPALDDRPERARCLREEALVEVAGPPARLLFPLTTERETGGVLEVETAAPMAEEQRRTVWSILRIYRNFQSLLDYSERDTLTGLLNRKTFDECFLRLAMESAGPARGQVGGRRQAAPLQAYIGVIDIDHFKRVNDNPGHLIGDEVLLLLSRQMRGCFRFHDHLFRFGGEEFVVLMRCARREDAFGAFERLRQTVAAHRFPRVGQITVSAGLSAIRAGDSPSAAFERADKAVYWAKQNGRNRVADHEALVASAELQAPRRESDVELF